MTNLAAEYTALANYRPTHKVRFVTAASLFDGHDAAINIMRRILQGMGAEVIHLGHNRSVEEVVTAALQEDVQGFGGGGGVIVPSEIKALQDYGVARIYSPEDGQKMGLAGMIGEMVMRCDKDISSFAPQAISAIEGHTDAHWRALAQLLTAVEGKQLDEGLLKKIQAKAATKKIPTIGITSSSQCKRWLPFPFRRRYCKLSVTRMHIQSYHIVKNSVGNFFTRIKCSIGLTTYLIGLLWHQR